MRSDEHFEEWLKNMRTDLYHVDFLFLQIAGNCLNARVSIRKKADYGDRGDYEEMEDEDEDMSFLDLELQTLCTVNNNAGCMNIAMSEAKRSAEQLRDGEAGIYTAHYDLIVDADNDLD
jgi:hypothetical protein